MKRIHLAGLLLGWLAATAIASEAVAQKPEDREPPRPGRAAPAPASDEMQEMFDQEGLFNLRFLRRLARRYAHGLGAVPAATDPAWVGGLRNLEGRPTALVMAFSTTLEGASPSVRGAAVARMLGQPGADREGGLEPGEFLTVIVGASPSEPRLVRLGKGLPPQAYRRFAMAEIADHASVPLAEVRIERVFYEPRLHKGFRFGFLGGAGNPERRYVWFLPSALGPYGEVVDADDFRRYVRRVRELRRQQRPTAEVASLAANSASYAAAAGTSIEIDRAAAAWGRTAHSMGVAEVAQVCKDCEESAVEGFHVGLRASVENIREATFAAEVLGGLNCTVDYQDGSTGTLNALGLGYPADDCYDITNWTSVCCLTDIRSTECIDGCSCKTTRSGTDVWGGKSRVLAGVPVLYQHARPKENTNCLIAKKKYGVLVGCGPIAAATVISWWDALGYDDLLADYWNTDGKIKWRALANTLSDDYLGTFCSTGTPNQSATEPVAFRNGLERFFADQGVGVSVTKYKVKEEGGSGDVLDVDQGWDKIVTAIDNDRPVVILHCNVNYDSSDDGCDGSLGITDVSLDWAKGHYAVIVGYIDFGGQRFVYTSEGMGGGHNELHDWEVPSGAVRLFFVTPSGARGTDTWCARDNGVDPLFTHTEGEILTKLGGEIYTQYRYLSYTYPTDFEARVPTCPDPDDPSPECVNWVVVHNIVGNRCNLEKDREEEQEWTRTTVSPRECVSPTRPDIDILINCEETPRWPGCDESEDGDFGYGWNNPGEIQTSGG